MQPDVMSTMGFSIFNFSVFFWFVVVVVPFSLFCCCFWSNDLHWVTGMIHDPLLTLLAAIHFCLHRVMVHSLRSHSFWMCISCFVCSLVLGCCLQSFCARCHHGIGLTFSSFWLFISIFIPSAFSNLQTTQRISGKNFQPTEWIKRYTHEIV